MSNTDTSISALRARGVISHATASQLRSGALQWGQVGGKLPAHLVWCMEHGTSPPKAAALIAKVYPDAKGHDLRAALAFASLATPGYVGGGVLHGVRCAAQTQRGGNWYVVVTDDVRG